MNSSMRKSVTTKTGKYIRLGASVTVEVLQGGIAAGITYGEIKLRVPMAAIGAYCIGFLTIPKYKKAIARYDRRGGEIVQSMTGETVEPDGYDKYGMPSVLIAGGFV